MEDALSDIAELLSWLDPCPVFVGGAIISLYLDPRPHQKTRATDDVDLIVPTVHSRGRWLMLQRDLTERGWQPDPDARHICRYISPEGHPVDFMAEDPTVLGFAGEWYPAAVRHAIDHPLPDGRVIRIPPAPLLLACKLEAYGDRGREDPFVSKDLEDIVTLTEGRRALRDEVAAAEPDLRAWIAARFGALLDDPLVHNCLEGHLPVGGDMASRGRHLRHVFATLAGRA